MNGSDLKRTHPYEESKRRYKATMEAFESDMLRQMAESGLRFSRWKNESDLFMLVSKVYPDAIYQYRCDWLGLQSLDVYIPSLKIGIEYQGEQHYHPVEFFGGEDAYKDVVIRDKRKAELCTNNGIQIVYWKYDEALSLSTLAKKISDAKKI